MSYYNQRTAILLFVSLFILQILVSASAEKVDSGKAPTLAFDELDKNVIVTGSKHGKILSTEAAADVDQQNEKNKVVGKDQNKPQQSKPQLNDNDDYEDDYEYIEIEVGGELIVDDDHMEEEDYMEDEALDIPPPSQEPEPVDDNPPQDSEPVDTNPPPQDSEPIDNNPPPQELEPFVDEKEFDPSTASADTTSVSISEEVYISMEALDVQKSAISSTRPPMPQVTGCKTQGQIALTYSEGPSDVTAKIVRQLTKADARANFFVNATWLYTQQYAMVLQNIYNAGHFIGMTYRVANDDPAALSDEDIRKDILNNAHIIETLINVAPKYVRLHYTEEKDVRTEGILADLGFIIVGYNLDSQDYMKKETSGANSIQGIYSETFKRYKDTYDSKGSFISIQYDLPYTGSLNAVSHIINTIDEEGYTMVRLDGCLDDPKPYKKFANSTEYVGDKFSFNQPGYHQGQKSIVLDATDTAEIEEDNFKIQGLTTSQATQLTPLLTVTLCIIGAIFTLFL